jgi:hypothetical protein
VETRQKNRISVDDVVSRPSSRKLVVTTPPGGSRRSRSRQGPNRTQEVVPDWQTGAAALRRATACSGGGVAGSRPRPGVEGKRNGIQGWTVFEIPSTLGSQTTVGSSACGLDRGQGSHVQGLGRRPRSFGRRGSWVVPYGEAERCGGGAQTRRQMSADRQRPRRRRGAGARA